MVNYPNGKKSSWTQGTTFAGNRGMTLEKEINTTNAYYLSEDKAVIHKKPTPVQIVTVDYPKRSAAKITEAYFKIPSTTDYNGIYQGKYLDFEAKECASTTSFPLKTIHPHQVNHLEAVLRHGAIAFLIVRFTALQTTYMVMAEDLISFYRTSSRSSIPLSWFAQHGHMIPASYLKPVDYLRVIDTFEIIQKEDVLHGETK